MTLGIIVAVLALIGTIVAAAITTRGNRQTAKETLTITREQGSLNIIQAANTAVMAENERLLRGIERRDVLLDERNAEIVKLRAEITRLNRRDKA